MGLITRPTKAHGQITYVDEVIAAAGHDTIKAVEVDLDFKTIYDDHNGNIDNLNISSTANISTSKIAQDSGLMTGHFADNSVTGDKIVDGTITDVDLAPDSITTAKILDGNVTMAKLAPGSTVRFGNGPSDETPNSITTEATILTFSTFAPAGAASIIAIHVSVNLVATFISAGVFGGTIRLKRNGSTIFSAPYTVAADTTTPTTIIPFTRSLSAIEALLSGPQDYIVTADASGTGTVTIFTQGVYGTLIEHA